MKLRYLLLHAYGTGGTIRTVFNQANAMAAAGHDVEVASVVRRRDEPRFDLDSRVRLTPLVDERPSAERRPGRLDRRGPKYVPAGETRSDYFSRHVERSVIRWMRGLHDGVLVTTRPALNLLAARHATSGVLRVAQEHMNLAAHKPDVRAQIALHYPRFDAVAVLTHTDRADYEQALPGTRVVRIPNAVHEPRQRHTTYANKVVVAAGRFVRQKGFDLLVQAFGQAVREYPDWQLRIFGGGERKDELRALINELDLYNHVLLTGFTSELGEELAESSLYVLSSRFEGLPMVMIEAMTHGLPVVSFNCPTGPADVITDGKEGLLAPPEDVHALALAMRKLMADEGLRADMGTAALHTARADYSPAAVRPQWEALFTELSAAGRADRRPRT